MFETTRVPLPMNCQDCLQQAVLVLEWFHLHSYNRPKEPKTDAERALLELAAAVRAELEAADLAAQAPCGRVPVQLIREFALARVLSTVVYCRARKPATLALEILCAEAAVPLKHVVKGFLTETDFNRLIKATRRVASAPLSFCDARYAALQARPVAELAARGYLGVAVADGAIDARELAELERVTAEWPIVVVAENTVRVE